MALQVVWTPDAMQQLVDILQYWKQRNGNPVYSVKLFRLIQNALTILAKYPAVGKMTEKSLVRAKIIQNYCLFYSIDATNLYVIGFCDMRRDPEFIDKLIE